MARNIQLEQPLELGNSIRKLLRKVILINRQTPKSLHRPQPKGKGTLKLIAMQISGVDEKMLGIDFTTFAEFIYIYYYTLHYYPPYY
tara:strand:+ start:1832 stop:2092 length:261 start_codon:yes stop_codon:yes gene_type:complete